MDSLHVSGQQTSSKTSSRSTSPCRPRTEHSHHSHHTKTLSHGSAESTKSQDGVTPSNRSSARHRSPTTSIHKTDMDDSGQLHSLDDTGLAEIDTSDGCYPSSFISNGSSELVKQDDETDSTRINPVIEHLENKIVRTRDLIRTEQKLRDDNVNEYLKLATNADKQQLQRIKAVFEKKNQKSAQVIAQLQRKLDNYQKRVQALETQGVMQGHRPTREVLRDMGQGLKNVGGNIRDGITGFSGSVMSKPREFAHLIKNKFGSADNISQLSSSGYKISPLHEVIANKTFIDTLGQQSGAAYGFKSSLSTFKGKSGPGTTGSEGSGTNGGAGSEQGEKIHHGSATLPATLHSATSQNSMSQNVPPKFASDGSECSSVTSESMERYGREQDGNHADTYLKAYYEKQQEEINRLKEKLDSTTKSLQQVINVLNSALQDERVKVESLEEQINDLTELHQNEMENLKQAMADMEEKVQYQSEERLRDIHEMLEHCQTKIQKMEHQALQQQQYVTLEGIDNSNARALVVKLINVLLTVLQVVLLLVATCAGIIMPFLRTRDSTRARTVFEIVDGTAAKISLSASRSAFFTRTFSKT